MKSVWIEYGLYGNAGNSGSLCFSSIFLFHDLLLILQKARSAESVLALNCLIFKEEMISLSLFGASISIYVNSDF